MKIAILAALMCGAAHAGPVHLSLDQAAEAKAPVLSPSDELQGLLRMIESNYGPLHYKESRFGYRWSTLRERYLKDASTFRSSDEFYYGAARLLSELRDAHVQITLPSNYAKELPLQFAIAEGKTVVAYIGKELVQSPGCPIEVGDELIEMDDKTPAELRAEMRKYVTTGNERTDLSYLTMAMTLQREQRGIPLSRQRGEVSMLSFKTLKGPELNCMIRWKETGVPLVDRSIGKASAEGASEAMELLDPVSEMERRLNTPTGKTFGSTEEETPRAKFIRELLVLQNRLANLHSGVDFRSPFSSGIAPGPSKEDGVNEDGSKGRRIQIGDPKPFFPLPANFESLEAPGVASLLTANLGMTVGKFEYKGKKIGFMRIPSYVPQAVQFAIFGLRYYFHRLQQETDYLIIDQSNNPGGYVPYSDWIISSLVGKPDARHMKFAVRPTQSFLRTHAELINMLEELENNPDALTSDRQLATKYLRPFKEDYTKVLEAYRAHAHLSEPIRLHLLSQLVEEMISNALRDVLYGIPNQVITWLVRQNLTVPRVYTKPVVMLINELDFSGGDATPAVLQDYGRVRLVGVGTAGAGGSVNSFRHDMDHSFGFSLTTSLMVRKGGVMVENAGVKPDLAFEPTVFDHATGFHYYFKRLVDQTWPF